MAGRMTISSDSLTRVLRWSRNLTSSLLMKMLINVRRVASEFRRRSCIPGYADSRLYMISRTDEPGTTTVSAPLVSLRRGVGMETEAIVELIIEAYIGDIQKICKKN